MLRLVGLREDGLLMAAHGCGERRRPLRLRLLVLFAKVESVERLAMLNSHGLLLRFTTPFSVLRCGDPRKV